MSKKNYYAIKYPNNTGVIVDNHHDFIKGMKGVSYSEGKGFKNIEEAKVWLEEVDSIQLSFLKEPKTTPHKNKGVYAIAIGRFVGVTRNKSEFERAIENYRDAKYRDDFSSEEEAWKWLEQQGFSRDNKHGIYAIARGRRTGIFTRLNTFQKNIIGYSNSVCRGNFKTKEEAKEWLSRRRGFAKAERRDILYHRKKNLPIVYTDGSFNSNQKKYGCAIIVLDTDGSIQTYTKANTIKSGSAHAEVEALFLCLKILVDVCRRQEFVLIHDYEELKRIAEGELRVRNVDHKLQKEIVTFIKDREISVHFVRVKAHSGNVGNTLADTCAKEAIKSFLEYKKLLDGNNLSE